LIEHYLASSGSSGAEQRPGFSGIIQSRCSPFEVVEQAEADLGEIWGRYGFEVVEQAEADLGEIWGEIWVRGCRAGGGLSP